MAVVFDAVNSGQRAQGGASSLTINLSVVSATNGYILVQVAVGRNTPVGAGIAVTIGGVSAGAAIASVNSGGGSSGGVVIFGATNASTGTVACVVTWPLGDPDVEAGAISFTGVHQTVSIGTAVTNSGSGTTASADVTDSAAGDLVTGAFVQGSGNLSSPGSGNTERWDLAQNGSSAGGCGFGTTAAGASGTVTMAGSWTGSDSWGAIGLTLKQAAGGGGRTTKNTRAWGLGMALGMDLWGEG